MDHKANNVVSFTEAKKFKEDTEKAFEKIQELQDKRAEAEEYTEFFFTQILELFKVNGLNIGIEEDISNSIMFFYESLRALLYDEFGFAHPFQVIANSYETDEEKNELVIIKLTDLCNITGLTPEELYARTTNKTTVSFD